MMKCKRFSTTRDFEMKLDSHHKPRIAVHKFSSCDGCQLGFLNLGEALLALARRVDIVHFAEAGPIDEAAEVDIAFVEGSVSTPQELARIEQVRSNCRYLITIGACATSGGLQAFRNLADVDEWMASIYPSPEFIQTLASATPISDHVRVDFEIWGCPIDGRQLLDVVKSLLLGVVPALAQESLCLECKRRGNVCVLVTRQQPCLGPVTQTGCGALCPSVGRDCYGCFGPREQANTGALSHCFEGFGLQPRQIAHRFLFINNNAPAFAEAGRKALEGQADE